MFIELNYLVVHTVLREVRQDMKATPLFIGYHLVSRFYQGLKG